MSGGWGNNSTVPRLSIVGGNVAKELIPCYNNGKDCEDRELWCHTKCEKWAAYQKEKMRRRKEITEKHSKEKLVEDYLVKEKIKNIKKRKQNSRDKKF